MTTSLTTQHIPSRCAVVGCGRHVDDTARMSRERIA